MDSDSVLEKMGITALTFQQLKEITNNFSDEQIIGRGGFASVYKVRSCMHGFEL